MEYNQASFMANNNAMQYGSNLISTAPRNFNRDNKLPPPGPNHFYNRYLTTLSRTSPCAFSQRSFEPNLLNCDSVYLETSVMQPNLLQSAANGFSKLSDSESCRETLAFDSPFHSQAQLSGNNCD